MLVPVDAPAAGVTRRAALLGAVTDTEVTVAGGGDWVEVSYARGGRTHLHLRFARDDPQLAVELSRLTAAGDDGPS